MMSGPGVIPSGALCAAMGAEIPELVPKSKSSVSVKQFNIFVSIVLIPSIQSPPLTFVIQNVGATGRGLPVRPLYALRSNGDFSFGGGLALNYGRCCESGEAGVLLSLAAMPEKKDQLAKTSAPATNPITSP